MSIQLKTALKTDEHKMDRHGTYFVRFGHGDDPGAVQRHLEISRMIDHLLGNIRPAKSAIQSRHLESAGALVRYPGCYKRDEAHPLIELSSNFKIKSSFDDAPPPPPVPIGRDLTRVGQELIHGPETGVLDVIVRSEAKPQVSLRRCDDGGESPAAISTHQCRIAVSPVTDLQKVVQAMFMRLDVEHVTEIDTNHEARLGCKCETNHILNLPRYFFGEKIKESKTFEDEQTVDFSRIIGRMSRRVKLLSGWHPHGEIVAADIF